MSATEPNIPTATATATIMREIEAKAERQVISELKFGAATGETLKQIIRDGATEFEQKTGRPMTYSEMRAMFG